MTYTSFVSHWVIAAVLSASAGCTPWMPAKTAGMTTRTCERQIGSIHLQMEASSSTGTTLDCLQVSFQIPKDLIQDPDVDTMSKEQLLQVTGGNKNKERYGLSDDQVQAYRTSETVILAFKWQNESLIRYLKANALQSVTPDEYAAWFTDQSADTFPASCQ